MQIVRSAVDRIAIKDVPAGMIFESGGQFCIRSDEIVVDTSIETRQNRFVATNVDNGQRVTFPQGLEVLCYPDAFILTGSPSSVLESS